MKTPKNSFKLIAIVLATYCLLLAAYSLLPTPIFAQEEPDFDRINEIAKKLNCPTCVGINLADCRTQTCEQWRDQIGELVEEGYTNQEVLDYFSTRYGDQVLQEPPRRGFSLALWILPIMAVLAGAAWLVYTMRGWRQSRPAPATASPVDPSEAPEIADSEQAYLSQVDQDLGET